MRTEAMVTAADSLAQLRAALGNNGACLEHARLQQVETQPLDDPDGLSFAILLGYTEEGCDGSQRKVLIHLYPLPGINGRAEIQFHSHATRGNEHARYDGSYIVKRLSRPAAAFALPGRTQFSLNKILALARYYFLQKLVEYDNNTDAEKIALGGLPLSKSMRDELEAACSAIYETSLNGGIPVAQSQHCEKPSSSLSRSLGAQEDFSITGQDIQGHQALCTLRAAQGQDLTKYTAEPPTTLNQLITLRRTEKRLEKDVRDLDMQLAALAAERDAKAADVDMVKRQQEELFYGLDIMEIYRLGEEVGRADVENHLQLADTENQV